MDDEIVPAGPAPSLYGFDVHSTPERDAALERLLDEELRRAVEIRSEQLITGHGV